MALGVFLIAGLYIFGLNRDRDFLVLVGIDHGQPVKFDFGHHALLLTKVPAVGGVEAAAVGTGRRTWGSSPGDRQRIRYVSTLPPIGPRPACHLYPQRRTWAAQDAMSALGQ